MAVATPPSPLRRPWPFLSFLCFLLTTRDAASALNVTVDLSTAAVALPPLFLSVTVDSQFVTMNYSDPVLRNLTLALSPAYIRYGGNSHQDLAYNFSSPQGEAAGDTLCTEAEAPTATNVLTPQLWHDIYDFSTATKTEVVFGLNGLTLHDNSSWNPEPALPFLEYVAKHLQFVGWELGNEPDLYYRRNITVTPEQRGADFNGLREILSKHFFLTWLMGPDVADPGPDGAKYMAEFLATVEPGVLDGATWHQYYGDGATAELWMTSDVSMLDKFLDEASAFNSTLRTSKHKDIWLWLGETSNFYGGGSPIVSDTYGAGFMWLDKLGIAARYNISIVCRQTLLGNAYALLDAETLTPHIDYWLSVLHKRLFSGTVLNVEESLQHGRSLRAYAHCTSSSYPNAQKGAVSMMLLNTDNTTSISVNFSATKLAHSQMHLFDLQPESNETSATNVLLNGQLLKVVNGVLPPLTPQVLAAQTTIVVQPTRYLMLVFIDAEAPACML
eukprot:m.73709 g.73709  ORF g.73709 m.73709 type:complete len:500 (+) comp13911_c0_seq1:101-1600(+)